MYLLISPSILQYSFPRLGRQSLCCSACLMSWSHLWLGFPFFFVPGSTSQRVANNATHIRCVLAGTQLRLQNHVLQTKCHLSSCLQLQTTRQERVGVKLNIQMEEIDKSGYHCFILASEKCRNEHFLYRAKMCFFTGITTFSWGQLTAWVTDDEKCN